jgi:hypothetical protein
MRILICQVAAATNCGDIVVRNRGSRNTPLTDSDIDVDRKEMDPVKAKHNKLKRLMIEIQSAHKRVHELQNTVELKVNFCDKPE